MDRKFYSALISAAAAVTFTASSAKAADYDYPDRVEHHSYYSGPAYSYSERGYDSDEDYVVVERDYEYYSSARDDDWNGVDDDADTTLSSTHNTSAYRDRY